MWKTFLWAFIFLHSGCCWAQQYLPNTLKPPLKTIFPTSNVQSSKIIFGDLNKDNIEDLAILLTEESDNGSIERVVIYKGSSDGSYALVSKSSTLEYGSVDFNIKNGSLFITAFHNSLTEGYSETYQFKCLNGLFLLIGKEEVSYNLENEDKFVLSENYLTGKKIEKRTVLSKSSESASQLSSKETRRVKLEEFHR